MVIRGGSRDYTSARCSALGLKGGGECSWLTGLSLGTGHVLPLPGVCTHILTHTHALTHTHTSYGATGYCFSSAVDDAALCLSLLGISGYTQAYLGTTCNLLCLHKPDQGASISPFLEGTSPLAIFLRIRPPGYLHAKYTDPPRGASAMNSSTHPCWSSIDRPAQAAQAAQQAGPSNPPLADSPAYLFISPEPPRDV